MFLTHLFLSNIYALLIFWIDFPELITLIKLRDSRTSLFPHSNLTANISRNTVTPSQNYI